MGWMRDVAGMMVEGSRHFARWELENARIIMGDRRRLALLGLLLLPAILGSVAFADEVSQALPGFIGGKEAYGPSYYSLFIFFVSIAVGMGAGLISGCIGAGGGFIIAPALMSAGVKGILAVGTDLFHIFAKAIMGSVLHRKMGNVSVPLAIIFIIGAVIGTTVGASINRALYYINPVLSDAFITIVYTFMLGFLGFYGLYNYFSAKRGGKAAGPHEGREGAGMTAIAQALQRVNLPPMVTFDQGLVPGGRKISCWFLILTGALVGMAAGIMGVGGGFLTFPIFVYVLGGLFPDHCGNGHFSDCVHCRLWSHHPVCHLWVYLLYLGHGHASGVSYWHPSRCVGDESRARHYHPWFFCSLGHVRLRQPRLCLAQENGRHGLDWFG